MGISKLEDTQSMRLLREMIDRGLYIFDIGQAEDAAISIDIQQTQLSKILSTLTQRGWLLRLRRGLYAGTGTLPGTIQVHSFAIATRLIEPSAISHWSAMQHHGLTEQIPQIVTAVTPKKVITPSMRVATFKKSHAKHMWDVMGVSYEYITINP